MNATQAHLQYTEQSLFTASPSELLLMLFNAEIKNIKAAIIFIKKKKMSEAHERLIKAQDIMSELLTSLDRSYSISSELSELYMYIKTELVMANITKDIEKLSELLPIVTELKTVWEEASKKAN